MLYNYHRERRKTREREGAQPSSRGGGAIQDDNKKVVFITYIFIKRPSL
jgi:hypothetical protein